MPAVSVALARPTRRRLVRALALFAAVLTFLALLLVAGPASAHDQLLSSDPEDGATLDEQPGSISLTFSASPLDSGIEVALVGPDGTTTMGSDIQVDDEVVTAQLPADLPSGTYDVAWHVVSSDGHPIDGEFTYTVAGAAEPSDEPTDEMPTQEAEPTDAAPTAGDAAESSTPAQLVGAGDGAGVGGLAVTGGILAAVLVVLGVVVMMRRKILENDKLRRANEPDPDDQDGEHHNENPDDKDKPKG